jgi:hypothetical protein
LADLLRNPAYEEKARGVAAAMADLPDVASSVSFLEELARR